MQKRTPAENYKQVILLREMAFKLKKAQVRKVYPELSDAEVEKKSKEDFSICFNLTFSPFYCPPEDIIRVEFERKLTIDSTDVWIVSNED
jgi:hypothetical protein